MHLQIPKYYYNIKKTKTMVSKNFKSSLPLKQIALDDIFVMLGFQVKNIGMPVNKIGGKLLNSNE